MTTKPTTTEPTLPTLPANDSPAGPTLTLSERSGAAATGSLNGAGSEPPSSGVAPAGLDQWGATSTTTDEAPPEPGWPRIAGFRLRERVGGDAQGDVYRAFDQRLRTEVAIKVPKTLDESAQKRFLEEARALARVQHRNIVGVRSCGKCGEQAYFVMDLVRGCNAAQLVKRFRDAGATRLDGQRILEIAGIDPDLLSPDVRAAVAARGAFYRLAAIWIAQAAEGLHAAHRAKVLHRDVKPSNLLLAPDGRLLVADFGLAKSSDDVPSASGSRATGTLPYLSPERAIGDWARVDHRADVWALGATLYEFITFQRAYPRGGWEVLADIATKDPLPPREVLPDVPPELEAMCLRAMRRDRDERYQSAAEMAEALRNWAAPALASPPSVTWRSRLVIALALGLAGAALAAYPPARAGGMELVKSVARFFRSSGTAPTIQSPTPAPPTSESKAQASSADPVSLRSPNPQSEIRDPQSAPAGCRGVLLAFDEDLNVDDDRPPRPGGQVLEKLRAYLDERRIPVCEPLHAPERWSVDQAVTAARELNAAAIVYSESRARKLRPAEPLQSSGEIFDKWEVGLHIWLIDPQTQQRRQVFSATESSNRLPAEEYDGDELRRMADEVRMKVADAVPRASRP